jgi:hypothetical protein
MKVLFYFIMWHFGPVGVIKQLPPFDQRQIIFCTGIYRCCSSIYNIFIHLKYCQDTINRQFNSTMETILWEKRRVACLTLGE